MPNTFSAQEAVLPSCRPTPASRLLSPFAMVPGALPAGLTLARASGGSILGPGPTLSIAPNHQPRFDYTPASGAFAGLVVEGQSTNLVPTSEPVSGPYTTVNGATLTAQSLNMWGRFAGLQVTTGGLLSAAARSAGITIANGASYTCTLWYRAGTSGKCRAAMPSQAIFGGPVGALAFVSAGGGVTVNSTLNTNHGNNVYSFSFTITLAGTGNTTAQVDGGPFSTVAGETVTLLAFQLEAGSIATSYIPTNGSAVTRLAESVTLTLPGHTAQLEALFDNTTSQTLTASRGSYALPALNRPRLLQLRALRA